MAFISKMKKVNTDLLTVPSIVCDDPALLVFIGQWLGVLNSRNEVNRTRWSSYWNMKERGLPTIPQSILDTVRLEMGKVLLRTGIDNTETCIFDQLDDFHSTFHCHLKNADKDEKVFLRWENVDDYAEIHFEDGPYQKAFEYRGSHEGRPSQVIMNHYTLKKDEKSCTRYFDDMHAEFVLREKDHSFRIRVRRPEHITAKRDDGFLYKIYNENVLEQYLLGLSFPVNICDAYNMLKDTSLGIVSDYPRITLEAKKETGYREFLTTDKLSLSHGELREFTITRGGRRVQIDDNGDWTFSSDRVSVSNSHEGHVGYQIQANSYDELSDILSLNQFALAKEEVESAKQYAKTYIQGKPKEKEN